ncbi:hypothetical protein QBC33DRAFT_571219 [Phialemonium atrogriseum]|uniref:Uncharacterized protein n=1 Tax=Phialemonium atrogriseum TaxID=1093897 RepID=A0AAJ0FEW6_9PEZI|nr:uncharacterized protein QBC33DRAFT_571219 [Phialemonium atrogriseum]KAK1766001.1 hypothetical protein QBC33DRAFT_571219 [Phialemonium atrogriseum]
MELTICFASSILLLLSLSSVTSALQLPFSLYILNPCTPGSVTIGARLEHHPNPHDLFCSITDTPAYPPDLFHKLNIDNQKASISRRGWANAVARLKEICACPAALAGAEELDVDIFVYCDRTYDNPEPAAPPTKLPRLFADVLGSMPKLKRLTWGISRGETLAFKPVFLERNLTLPELRYLKVDRYSEYLVDLALGLEQLVSAGRTWIKMRDSEAQPDARLLFIEAAGRTKNLTGLVLDAEVDAIRANVPNISSLSLPGEISQRWRTRDRFPPPLQSGEALRELINILTALPNLRKLSLPSALHLDLGMNGGYSGSALGRPLGREDIVEDAEATALAGEIVIGLLPQLTIGVQSANITRDNNDGSGAASLTWPWTGSMDDYANMNTEEECSDPWETGYLPDMHWVN